MVIFKYEMKQLRNSIVIWSAALGAAILLMLPVYIAMLTSTEFVSFETFTGHRFFDAIGTTIEILTTPLGTYSFLTFFVLFACAMHGMNMGITMITKEYRQNSADFLFTKPYSRTIVYMSKLLAGASAALIIGGVYFAASWGAMMMGTDEKFSLLLLALIAFSTIFIQLLFLAIGMFIGVVAPRIKAPLSISAGTVFLTYGIGSFSRVVDIDFFGYFSPHLYFNGANIILTGGYEAGYMLLFVTLLFVFIAAGHHIFCKKDVILVS